MWSFIKYWSARTWPWIIAAVAAIATIGVVRRFSLARERSNRVRDGAEDARVERLQSAQRSADAQRAEIMRISDETERRARAAGTLDATLRKHLDEERRDLHKMSNAELRAAAQRQADRVRGTFRIIVLAVSVTLSQYSVASAEDICIPREDLEVLVWSSQVATERVVLMQEQIDLWQQDAELLRVAVSAGRSAETAATHRADLLQLSLTESRSRLTRANSLTKWWTGGGIVVGVLTATLVAWAAK